MAETSWNKQVLEAIRAQILGVATAGQRAVSLGDLSLQYIPTSELLTKWLPMFEARVAAEERAANGQKAYAINYHLR